MDDVFGTHKVDTTTALPEDCARLIVDQLPLVQTPKAFDRLRQRRFSG